MDIHGYSRIFHDNEFESVKLYHRAVLAEAKGWEILKAHGPKSLEHTHVPVSRAKVAPKVLGRSRKTGTRWNYGCIMLHYGSICMIMYVHLHLQEYHIIIHNQHIQMADTNGISNTVLCLSESLRPRSGSWRSKNHQESIELPWNQPRVHLEVIATARVWIEIPQSNGVLGGLEKSVTRLTCCSRSLSSYLAATSS